jgi:hypothetical protein
MGINLGSPFKLEDGSYAGSLWPASYPLGSTFSNNGPDGVYCTVTDKAPGLLIGNKGAPCDSTGFGALPSYVVGGIVPGNSKADVFF